jgi:hypothetical protein
MIRGDYSIDEIIERRDEYKNALRTETQASASVRNAWKKLVSMLDDLITYRTGADKMVMGPPPDTTQRVRIIETKEKA